MMEVRVEAGSRLHLGLIDFTGKSGRLYGGVGVYVQHPALALTIEKSGDTEVSGDERGLFASHAEKFLKHYNLREGVRMSVLKDIPAHAGMGSGTQSALTVGAGLAKLFGLNVGVKELASLYGRGGVSAVGTYLFMHGGFVVEGGRKKDSDALAPLIARYDFPQDWGFVLVVPEIEEGLSGTTEKKAMQKAREKPADAKEAAQTILMKMLPALIEEDIASFGEALSTLDQFTGKNFEKTQEGVYRLKAIEALAATLTKKGAYGCGQSSWGPTVYALTTKKESSRLIGEIRDFLDSEGVKGGVFYSSARNSGADII